MTGTSDVPGVQLSPTAAAGNAVPVVVASESGGSLLHGGIVDIVDSHIPAILERRILAS